MTANKLSTLEGEQHAITLHFKWEGAQPHIAYKVDETGVVTTTPGVPMRDEGNGWYTYTISDAEVANMVISIELTREIAFLNNIIIIDSDACRVHSTQ